MLKKIQKKMKIVINLIDKKLKKYVLTETKKKVEIFLN